MSPYPRAEERRRMVERQIEARGIRNARVLAAMREIPRHHFIPPPFDQAAYDDNPLPIGSGQTISQPYIVALMTELLRPEPSDNVLEIGAGSGYQAAILSRLVQTLTTIERIPAVAVLARNNLKSLGIQSVEVIEGDGTEGCPQNAPYNGIMITAATPEIPKTLINQ
ncbi:MAG: protein-L-isoaspartate(D-aspartate) O-methyltransferase, partial [Methanoregula sp.]|nr:protein-L-isoaspartate(D-aspartate) O-methyltransferase [Methanoregula sp.]